MWKITKSDVIKFLNDLQEKYEWKYIRADEKDDSDKMNEIDEKLEIIENIKEELNQI